MAKDLTNLSCRKYIVLQQTLKEINGNNIPGIRKLSNSQYKMNNFFNYMQMNAAFI